MLDILKSYVFPYFNFIVFAAIVFFLGRKPIKNMFINRFNNFNSEAKSIKEQFEKVQKENLELSQRLASLDKEIDNIKKQAEQTLQSEILNLENNTKKIVEHIHEETKRITQSEVNEGLSVLKKELISSAVLALEKKIKDDLGESLQTKLAESAINQLGQATRDLSSTDIGSGNSGKDNLSVKKAKANSDSNANR